jgi:hypothetical protein
LYITEFEPQNSPYLRTGLPIRTYYFIVKAWSEFKDFGWSTTSTAGIHLVDNISWHSGFNEGSTNLSLFYSPYIILNLNIIQKEHKRINWNPLEFLFEYVELITLFKKFAVKEQITQTTYTTS